MPKFALPNWKTLVSGTCSVWLLILAVESVCAEGLPQEGLQWLNQMRDAVARLNYTGVVAYLKNKKVESFQIFHASTPTGERERLISMNSPLREVVRNAEKVACYFPDTRTAFFETKPAKRSVLLDLPGNLSQFARHYRVELKEQEYVARRMAQVLSIEPLDEYRYSRRVWVDVDSKLPLKFEVLDDEQEVVEQVVFTALQVGADIPIQDLEPSKEVQSIDWQVSQREMLPLDSLDWTLAKVPDGFQMISYTRLKRPSARPVDHILLSDGFSSVSIYIDEIREDIPKGHSGKVGAIHSHSRRIDQYLVTVMGEVPAKTVQVIADGLRYQDRDGP
jgi:sigma-E factor negative regulatory protein RseB